MTETNNIWSLTLAEFRQRMANAGQPTTGVSVAVVSGVLGISLLQMVLELMAKRSTFVGDPRQLSRLLDAAGNASQQLMGCADADVAAYLAYKEARRSKGQPSEIMNVQRATIEVPLQAARGSLGALNLCLEAADLVTGPIVADLVTAAMLLEGAVRCVLRCASENLRALPDEHVAEESSAIQREAADLLKAVVLRTSQ